MAVDSVDLEVPEGAIYALVGANGAGKTTIIKMLMNIFNPSEGHVEVLGTDASTWRAKRSPGSVMFQRIRKCLNG